MFYTAIELIIITNLKYSDVFLSNMPEFYKGQIMMKPKLSFFRAKR